MTAAAPKHPASRTLDSRAAARFLGICSRTLHSWRSQGRGPRCHRLGRRRIVYWVRDLEAYLYAGTVGEADR